MTARGTVDDSDTFCPVDTVFGESGIPDDCRVLDNSVRCSPLDHHAELLSISTSYELLAKSPDDAVRGSGLTSAQQIVFPAFQLKKEYNQRVKSGVFAQIVTPAHRAYPMTIFYGFLMVAAHDGFTFANTVQQKIESHFKTADVTHTDPTHIAVLTSTNPFPQQLITKLKNPHKWGSEEIL